MKKMLALLLTAIMVLSLVACGSSGGGSESQGETSGTSEAAAEPAEKADAAETEGGASAAADDLTWGLTPYDDEQSLTIGFFTGSPLSYPFLFAENLGVFDALNIDVEFECFTGGPAMVEASSTYDIASCGLGGLCIAMANGMHIIDITDYEENLALFAREGSDLANDPKNPDNWKGTTWVYPTGTTAQAVLANALSDLGLSLNDIESVNMDNANALTGFDGGTGDGLGCWNAIALSAEDKGYIRLGDAGTLGFTAPCGTIVKPEVLDEKLDLITTACIVFHKAVEWCYESDANLEQAAQWYYDHCEEEGFLCTEDVAQRTMEWYRGPVTDKWISLYTDTSADDKGLYTGRDLLQAEKDILVGLDFFIGEGKYTAEQRTSFLDDGLIDPVVAENAAAMLK